MQRNPDSHKGDNGSVAIIGGSKTMHGAPLLAALAAEASGVDLVYVALPQRHEHIAKQAALNFQVHSFVGDELSEADREPLLELLASMDAALIGPGIGRDESTIAALLNVIAEAACPLVLDATALQPNTLEHVAGKSVILTPHLGELERMGLDTASLDDVAKDTGITILRKGPIDKIYSPQGNVYEVAGGNAGLTVGGTGDALAGLTAGLFANLKDPVQAAKIASRVIKRAATTLYPTAGYNFTTQDVIAQIPHLLHTLNEDHT